MPASTPTAVRRQIGQRTPDPIYLVVGDDDAEMSHLVATISDLVEEELRGFNLERIYASDKGVKPFSIVQAARTLPMLGDRRVVVVLRAERFLKPKRGGKTAADADAAAAGDEGEPAGDLESLEEYVKRPEPLTVLVLVAADVDRQRRIYKVLQKSATVVECWGLKGSKDGKPNPHETVRAAEALIRQAVTGAGQQIEPAASRLVAARAGTDISRLRADVERLLLYAAGKPKITVVDAREVVSSETAQDDWAVTNAIGRRDAAEALRQLALSLDAGGVSYQILGQLGWYVREKMPAANPRRVPAAVDALFRTDLELKSSAGDPRVLLERLIVDLCGR